MRLRMLILAAGLLWPASSFSQGSGQEYFFKTGNVLLANCSGPPSSPSYVACFSYIAGVADAYRMLRTLFVFGSLTFAPSKERCRICRSTCES
jgi:hypothetical protein